MWFAYVLRSMKDNGFYVGMSSDVERRLKEHNAGYNRSTRPRIPFELIYVERCGSRLDARKREKFLKSGAGREFIVVGRFKAELRSRAGVTQR
jgi:putative endonuclease